MDLAIGNLNTNSDNFLDLAVAIQRNTAAGSQGFIFVYFGQAGGTFATPTQIPLPTVPARILTRDFRDVRSAQPAADDLVVLGAPDSTNVYVAVANRDPSTNRGGTFQAPVAFPVGSGASSFDMAAPDFNGDGKLDLAIPRAGPNINAVAILLNTTAVGVTAPGIAAFSPSSYFLSLAASLARGVTAGFLFSFVGGIS